MVKYAFVYEHMVVSQEWCTMEIFCHNLNVELPTVITVLLFWWCHDIGYPLLAAEHSLCKAPWSGTPCQTTSVHSRTVSPLDSA